MNELFAKKWVTGKWELYPAQTNKNCWDYNSKQASNENERSTNVGNKKLRKEIERDAYGYEVKFMTIQVAIASQIAVADNENYSEWKESEERIEDDEGYSLHIFYC